MRIAVSSEGEGLDALIDSRFGRCSYFVIYDTETGDVESVPNPSVTSAHGAGVAAVQFIIEKGVKAVLAQRVGPNAERAFATYGIPVSSPKGRTVGDAIREYEPASASSMKPPKETTEGRDSDAKI